MLYRLRQIVSVVEMQFVLLLFMMCWMLNSMYVEKIVIVSIDMVSISVGSCRKMFVIDVSRIMIMFMNSYLLSLEKLCLLMVVIVVIVVKMMLVLLNVSMISDGLFEKLRMKFSSCDSIRFMKNVKFSSMNMLVVLFFVCLIVNMKLNVIVKNVSRFIIGFVVVNSEKFVVMLIQVFSMVGIIDSVSSQYVFCSMWL